MNFVSISKISERPWESLYLITFYIITCISLRSFTSPYIYLRSFTSSLRDASLSFIILNEPGKNPHPTKMCANNFSAVIY